MGFRAHTWFRWKAFLCAFVLAAVAMSFPVTVHAQGGPETGTTRVDTPSVRPPGTCGPQDPVGHNHGLSDAWRAGIQPGTGFLPASEHDPAVPSPADHLGFPLGAHPVVHGEVLSYVEALAEASPHVRIIRNGRTHEGRCLVTAIVTSEANMARLGEIMQALGRLADPRQGEPPATENLPLCVWMGACVHGDEISGTEAALYLTYHIAAGSDHETEAMRAQMVLLIEPLQNPDGRDRVVHAWRSLAGVVPDADDQSLRHHGYWSRGRTNHYLFDLNRDWFLVTQPETQGRVGLISSWNPQLIIDAHEMDSQATFLFSPPREPFNPLVTEHQQRWWRIFAADHGAAFDARGWPYYTGEWHEEWYPGFATSWAAGVGAIGLLYEQARTNGTRVARVDGSVLTFRESIDHQFGSFMANLRTALAHRGELLEGFRAERARELAEREGCFVLLPHAQPARAEAVVAGLLAQGIEVYRTTEAKRVGDLRCYWTDETSKELVPAGALVVPTRQPFRRLVETILAFDPQMDGEFLRTERERLEREGRSRLYDVTGWSVSTSSGLPVYRLDQMPWGRLERVEETDREAAANVATAASGQAPAAATAGDAPGTVVYPESPYGFLIDGGDDRALRALARLWDAGCTVHAAREPLQSDGRRFPRGTLLIRRDLNRAPSVPTANGCAVGYGLPHGDAMIGPFADPDGATLSSGTDRPGEDSLLPILEAVAARTGVTIVGARTALSEEGPDLGSPRFRQLWPPRIGVAAGEVVSWTSYGAVAWVLDHEMRVAMSPLSVQSLRTVDLSRYDVLVLPSTWEEPDAYGRYLGGDGLRRLRSWVYDGGTLIASGTAAAFLADTSSGLGTVRVRRQVLTEIAARTSQVTAAVPSQDEPEAPAVPARAPRRGDLTSETFRTEALRWAKAPGPMDGLVEGGLRSLRRPEPFWQWAAGRARAEIEREDQRMRLFHPRGSLLKVMLDDHHWLSSGCAVLSGFDAAPLAGEAPGEWLAARVYAEHALVAENPADVVGAFAPEDSLRLSGLLWPEARERWADTAYLTRERIGRGQLVLFVSDPCERGTLEASERAFLNAVMLGPGLGTTRRWPW